jgi:putative DNA primase/helicase
MVSEHDDTTPPDAAGDDNVVGLDQARKKRTRAAAASTDAPAPSDAKREARKTGAGGKKEKKIDNGRYNYMVENFVLVYPTDTAWDRDKRKLVKIANMGHMFGADYVRMWKGSPDRKTVDEEELVFDPTLQCGKEAINLYDGFAIEPAECDAEECDPMLQLLEHLCGRCADGTGIAGKERVMEWVLRWLALPLQRPGAKPRSALVFHGPQGTGKNLFFDVIRGIYGKYGVMVGQTEIEEKYNSWLSAKLLVIGNEVVSRQELYHGKNRLKWIITEAERIPIRSMHTDTRWETNHANVVFLSNESMPLALETGDRRYLVVYTPVPEEGDLYSRVREFLANDGAAKFFHFLLKYNLGDFHEHSKPPMTEAKEALIELGMKPAERFMRDWHGGFLDLPENVCSAEQLYRAFRRWCDRNGERWWGSQAQFTSDAKRWSGEFIERGPHGEKRDPCFVYKVVSTSRTAGERRSSYRCWLPRGTGPMNGVHEGDWVEDSIKAFEPALVRFLDFRAASESGGGGDPPSPETDKKGGRRDGAVSTSA